MISYIVRVHVEDDRYFLVQEHGFDTLEEAKEFAINWIAPPSMDFEGSYRYDDFFRVILRSEEELSEEELKDIKDRILIKQTDYKQKLNAMREANAIKLAEEQKRRDLIQYDFIKKKYGLE